MDHIERITTPQLAMQLDLDMSPSPVAHINYERLQSLSEWISGRPGFANHARAKWDNTLFWNVDGSRTERSQYFAVGNSINFRYWSLSGGQLRPARGVRGGTAARGAEYMWRCLRVALDKGLFPILDAQAWSNLTEEQFDEIFRTDDGGKPLDIAKGERIANLRDLGNKLTERWDGQFINVVETAHRSLAHFAHLSTRFRAYDDPYYKLTMVNAILHLGSRIAEFDADPLPGIDYQLVKQLVRMGVVVPTREVGDKLQEYTLLTRVEASELRRIALAAFVKVSEKTGISGEILDNRWWENRVNCLDNEPVCLNPETAPRCPFYGICRQNVNCFIPLEETRYY